MRVSTAQFYYQSSLQMSNKSSEVNEQMAYLSSGKQVLTAKDDAVQYSTLAGYKESLASLEKYQRNITMATSHNSLQEVIFSDAETILDNIKQDMLLANNGRMSNEDLQALASEMRTSFDQLLDLANTQDEQGEYIFSGYQTQQQPFIRNANNSVAYSGDTGVNELQIAKNINIATNQTGDASFMTINNAIGDFSANYPTTPANSSGIALESAKVVDRNTYNITGNPDYTFTFGPGAAQLNVVDAVGNSHFTTTSYVAGQTISFEGIDVTLSGNPLPGDTFTIGEQEDISMFSTINDAISWIDRGVVSTSQEQHQVDYNTILEQLNTVMSHTSSRRADAGIRLQVLENQTSRHLDAELHLTSGKANIEDLDFAKAIAEFEQSQTALQASQQTFSQVQNLSLFNYI